jgi:hypothetical protein
VLMRAGNRGIHADVPRDQTSSVRAGLQPGHDACPDPATLPTPEQPVHRLPGAVARRHIPPRGTHPNPPPDPDDELPLRPLRRPTRPLRRGQQRRQHHRKCSTKRVARPAGGAALHLAPPKSKVDKDVASPGDGRLVEIVLSTAATRSSPPSMKRTTNRMQPWRVLGSDQRGESPGVVVHSMNSAVPWIIKPGNNARTVASSAGTP